eukprot:CAMPEP_0198114670 /NCGR_PEP_ID=MMETSP1442-20131203/5989_1 /TAXON_ID= /ORGANISM="Craspedostauros australis, Strain CCMP3328" /LENGTH=217 /DNA_ID=CAMNT_0043772039 /DNA_START=357 /DNA_END=1009 /DNA_ORIENTATION=+
MIPTLYCTLRLSLRNFDNHQGSFGMFCVIDWTQELPEHCRVFPQAHMRRKNKKKQDDDDDDQNAFANTNGLGDRKKKQVEAMTRIAEGLHIVPYYTSMLFLDFLDANEMVIVEQPWLDVVATFPSALKKRVYGIDGVFGVRLYLDEGGCEHATREDAQVCPADASGRGFLCSLFSSVSWLYQHHALSVCPSKTRLSFPLLFVSFSHIDALLAPMVRG